MFGFLKAMVSPAGIAVAKSDKEKEKREKEAREREWLESMQRRSIMRSPQTAILYMAYEIGKRFYESFMVIISNTQKK
ncbi:hypothetical protein [Helicobacter vulpis]|uniref:hypothetical protein n=1 Tax=Helicobacter vulpis TaxID=2316076 RepID=UPI000EAEF9C5|nr:hypothetical protein [Helicobacter vulpis]